MHSSHCPNMQEHCFPTVPPARDTENQMGACVYGNFWNHFLIKIAISGSNGRGDWAEAGTGQVSSNKLLHQRLRSWDFCPNGKILSLKYYISPGFMETGSCLKERNHPFQSAAAQPQKIHRNEGHYGLGTKKVPSRALTLWNSRKHSTWNTWETRFQCWCNCIPESL